MKIYKIEFNKYTYDQYDSFIVRAENEEMAIGLIIGKFPPEEFSRVDWKEGYKVVEVLQQGQAEIILKSYNAG